MCGSGLNEAVQEIRDSRIDWLGVTLLIFGFGEHRFRGHQAGAAARTHTSTKRQSNRFFAHARNTSGGAQSGQGHEDEVLGERAIPIPAMRCGICTLAPARVNENIHSSLTYNKIGTAASDHCHTTKFFRKWPRVTQHQHRNADAIARRRRKWRRAN